MATWDFSELDEAAKLLRDLLQRHVSAGVPGAPAAPAGPAPRSGAGRAPGQRGPPPMPADARQPAARAMPPAEPVPPAAHRAGRLVWALSNLCRRTGFNSAAIADDAALPMAAHECPGGAERFAAFTTVLGVAGNLARDLLQQQQMSALSIEVDTARKIVLRKFDVGATHYYLFILGPKAVDGQPDIDQAIAFIQQTLSNA